MSPWKCQLENMGGRKSARYETGLHATGVKLSPVLLVPAHYKSRQWLCNCGTGWLAGWQCEVHSHNFLRQQSLAEYLPRFHCSKLMQASNVGEVSLTEREEERKTVTTQCPRQTWGQMPSSAGLRAEYVQLQCVFISFKVKVALWEWEEVALVNICTVWTQNANEGVVVFLQLHCLMCGGFLQHVCGKLCEGSLM